jgi:predicted GNAT family acetyltransferase
VDIDLDSLNVTHHESKDRFEIRVDVYVAELTYVRHGNTILFTHTGVPPALEGNGIGSKLVQAGLDYARANNLRVQSTCWFVTAYMKQHPEYKDLLQ